MKKLYKKITRKYWRSKISLWGGLGINSAVAAYIIRTFMGSLGSSFLLDSFTCFCLSLTLGSSLIIVKYIVGDTGVDGVSTSDQAELLIQQLNSVQNALMRLKVSTLTKKDVADVLYEKST